MNADSNKWPKLDQEFLLRLIEQTTVWHPDLTRAKHVLELCLARRRSDRKALYLIYGDTGCGKTRVIEDLMSRNRESRDKNGKTVRVMLITAPTVPKFSALAKEILEYFGAPALARETETDFMRRIRSLIQQSGTEVIIIDEFQQVYHNLSDLEMFKTCDWLKSLIKGVGNPKVAVSIVLAGLPDCTEVIRAQKQLRRLLSLKAELRRFDWNKASGSVRLSRILTGYHEALSKYMGVPKFGSDEFAFRWYLATGGVFSYLVKILCRAIELVCESGKPEMTMATLHQAYLDEVWNDERDVVGDLFPFSGSFKPLVSDELLNRVKAMGASPEIAPRRHLTIKPKRVRVVGRIKVEAAGARGTRKGARTAKQAA